VGSDGQPTGYEYDAAGRRSAVVDALGNRTEFGYDLSGNMVLRRDVLLRSTTFAYDAVGRATRQTFPDGTFVATTYDRVGRKTSETDQAGRTRDYEYDAAGNLVAAVLPAVPDPGAGGAMVRPRYEYGYDVYGNRRTVRDPLGRVTRYSYDYANRQLNRTLPGGQTESTEYEANGRPRRQIDFNGQVTQFVYDGLGRRVQERFFDSVALANADVPQLILATVFDAAGRPDTVNDSLRGLTDFDHDDDGRVTRIANPEGVIAYEYDAATGRQLRAFTDFSDVRYAYDALGRLRTVSAVEVDGVVRAAAQVTTYSYTATGMQDTIVLPNGAVTGFTYDSLDRLIRLRNANPAGGLLSQYEYTLAADARRLSALEARLEADGSESQIRVL
jgi:YD repeat-containing protein